MSLRVRQDGGIRLHKTAALPYDKRRAGRRFAQNAQGIDNQRLMRRRQGEIIRSGTLQAHASLGIDIMQRAAQRHMKAELLLGVRIAPALQQHFLPRRQCIASAARQFALAQGCAQAIELTDALRR